MSLGLGNKSEKLHISIAANTALQYAASPLICYRYASIEVSEKRILHTSTRRLLKLQAFHISLPPSQR